MRKHLRLFYRDYETCYVSGYANGFETLNDVYGVEKLNDDGENATWCDSSNVFSSN